LELAQSKVVEQTTQHKLEQRELRQQLCKALVALPTKCRSVFEKSCVKGLSQQQITKDEKSFSRLTFSTVSIKMVY
jgi:DNA-directed RNA polymerase specialized sigma24 family protein